MAAAYLAQSDLEALIGAQKVLQYFDDDGTGSIDGSETGYLNTILEAAESIVESRLRRAYSDSDSITDLAENDKGFKIHAAWIAIEMASERRPEFSNNEGWGAFKAQYERAIEYFDMLSKGNIRSKGETVAGEGANTGGNLQPALQTDQARFTFAPDNDYPTGHGGF
jgi:hypothetical protein